eukprot:2356217-Rhodomonas_salina.4
MLRLNLEWLARRSLTPSVAAPLDAMSWTDVEGAHTRPESRAESAWSPPRRIARCLPSSRRSCAPSFSRRETTQVALIFHVLAHAV